MADVWEAAWERLSETFLHVAWLLESSCPGVTWPSGHGDNKAFPFRAYANVGGLLAARTEIDAAVKEIADFMERNAPMLHEAISTVQSPRYFDQ